MAKSIEIMSLVLLLSILMSTLAFVPTRNNRVVSSKVRMAPTPPPPDSPEGPPKRETNPLPVPTVGLGKDQVISELYFFPSLLFFFFHFDLCRD